MSTFIVAVLTVSDTAATSGCQYDTSGPHLRSLISSHPSYTTGPSEILPDDAKQIRQKVMQWSSDGKIDWVVITGGTGWSDRDVTPQALRGLLEPLPVLQHHLNDVFLEKTPMSVLSRPVAGLCGRTLVVALPGSQRACSEGWEALVGKKMQGVLEHGFKLLRGGNGEDVHVPRKEVKGGSEVVTVDAVKQEGHGSGTGHHHHHHHGHVGRQTEGEGHGHAPGIGHHHSHEHGHRHDDGGVGGGNEHHHGHGHSARMPRSQRPGGAVSDRLRKSPYPMIPLSSALSLIHQHSSQPLPIITHKVDHTLPGHVLAEAVFAESNIPRIRTTNVDGYAVVAGKTKEGAYQVVKADELGDGDGKVVRVNTGGPLPLEMDAVVMVEDTELRKKGDDGAELEIEILARVPQGENVRQPGSDAKIGDKVLDAGVLIGSGGGEVGLLGFVGRREVKVYKRPVVAILSTGDELVSLEDATSATGPSATPSGWTGVVDTNRPSLRATLEGLGYEVVDVGIARDKLEEQHAALEKALSNAEVVVSTGGTSMGEADFLKPLIEHQLGGTIHFGRVAMKPGKPTTFATVPRPDGTTKYVFALPGNPASALVTFYLFVLPLLRGLGGWPEKQWQLPRVQVELLEDMSLDPREEFHRVFIGISTSKPGTLTARSTGGQRSSRVASLCGANGLVHLPAQVAGREAVIRSGEKVTAVVIGELMMGV